MLTEEQKAFYQELGNTFDTPGWAHLKQGWTAERDTLAQALFFNAKTMEDLNAARVRYSLLDELINLPETLQAQREAIEEQEQEDV